MIERRRKRSRHDGFTLVELMIVMVILAIIMALAIPSYLGHKTKAQATAAKAMLKEIRDAVDSCAAGTPRGLYGPTPDCTAMMTIIDEEPSLAIAWSGASTTPMIMTVSANAGYSLRVYSRVDSMHWFMILYDPLSPTPLTKTCNPVGSKWGCNGPAGNQW